MGPILTQQVTLLQRGLFQTLKRRTLMILKTIQRALEVVMAEMTRCQLLVPQEWVMLP